MSVILNNNSIMSLVEANKRAGYDRNEGFLLDLRKQHHALDVLPFLPASDGAFHSYTKAKKLGSGDWRAINEGRKPTYGVSESVTTPVQLFSTECNISDDVMKLADSPADTRDSENLLVATGLVDQFMDNLINSDGSNPLAMKGFEFYRPKLGDYCINGGGTATQNGKLSSIYLCEMGEYGVNVRYNPKMTGGSDGIGLSIKDEGAVWMNDQNNRHMKVWKTTYDLTAGLEVRQDAALVRIANVPTVKVGGKSGFDPSVFIEALNLLPRMGENAVAFCPRPIYAQLMQFAFESTSNNMTVETIENFGPVVKVMGIPFLREDSIKTGLNVIA